MSEQQPTPTTPDREPRIARVNLAPAAGPEVEAHAAGPAIDVVRLTLQPVEGDPIVLEPAGVDAEGLNIYRVVSGLPDVEAHGGHRCCT